MAVHLRLRQSSNVPLEVAGVLPSAVQGKSLTEIGQCPIMEGNRCVLLADFFDLRGYSDDATMVWEGDLTGVHWIGAGMSSGKTVIRGDVGRHVGSRMSGGRIEVDGSTSDWAGAEMQGGTLHIRGSTGHLVGAAYRGSTRGMTGGTLLVEGDAGDEVGHTMRRGLIAVAGSCGDLVGSSMLAGTILVFGNGGVRHGAGMQRGTIAVLGNEPVPLLPTFRSNGRLDSLAMKLVMRSLEEQGFPLPQNATHISYHAYHGDLLDGGRGELLVRAHGA